MSGNKCEECRFTCKNLLNDCRFFSPERRKQERDRDEKLKQFWENIYAQIR